MEAVGRCERGLELHAGAGFFTVGLARRCARVLAVESSAAAVRDLEHNLRAAGCANVEVQRSEAEALLEARAFAAFAPELVLLDPPRTGLARGAARELAALGARRVVYVSCDPATLARDAAALVQGGTRLVALTGLDQFPHTPHVEAIAVFDRRA
jgi:23S rRNA (uracil1939-C5)-methyltransferase